MWLKVFFISVCLIQTNPVLAKELALEKAPETALASQEEREAFARDFATKVLAILQDQKKNFSDRKDVLRRAFSNSVDIDWIARFVLGKSWNSASEEQKTRYTTLYRTFLTNTYVSNFAENPDKRIRDIKILAVNGSEASPGDFTVRTQMLLADTQSLKVSYLVREQEKRYRVLDIAIENVSLITTHRSEFTALAASKGVTGVIAQLEKLVEDRQSGFTLSMN